MPWHDSVLHNALCGDAWSDLEYTVPFSSVESFSRWRKNVSLRRYGLVHKKQVVQVCFLLPIVTKPLNFPISVLVSRCSLHCFEENRGFSDEFMMRGGSKWFSLETLLNRMSGIWAYLSSFSQMDINKHFPPIGYKSLTFKNELLHCVLFIFCKICNYGTYTLLFKSLGQYLLFSLKKLILLFSKDAFSWSKETVNTFTLLKKVVLNEWILTNTTVFNIDGNNKCFLSTESAF